MSETYELWADAASGEVYAVRLEEGKVAGYCGPLSLEAMALADPERFPYHPNCVATIEAMCEWRREELSPPSRPRQRLLARAVRRVACRRRQAR